MEKLFYTCYDKYIVAFSGGKDSTACFLHLLNLGIPKEKIELWHHLVDGREEGVGFMDWDVTEDYCRKFAKAFGVPIYFSWKEGGFKREMLRDNSPTARTWFETPDGLKVIGGKGPNGTRLKFPQVAADLRVRWCSAYLKIDICAAAIRNQDRFNGKKTLLISGERGEESPARAKYKMLEPDRSDGRSGRKARHVDRWRPIRDWTEQQVWDIIKSYNVVAHPCYYAGFGRCSCKYCIFGNANQFASAHEISPEQGDVLMKLEDKLGVTLKRKGTIQELIDKGVPYDASIGVKDKHEYTGKIITEHWTLPDGAFGESCGPT